MKCGTGCREVLRDDVIPYAIKWFTGEAQADDSEDEDDEDDEDDEGDEDDEVTIKDTSYAKFC